MVLIPIRGIYTQRQLSGCHYFPRTYFSHIEAIFPPSVETTVVALLEREKGGGVTLGYVTRKDAVTISPVHTASLAAALPLPHSRLI